MAALTDTTIASTYKQLLKITSEGVGADASAKYVEDGLGTDTALSLSTTRVGIGTASPAKPLHISSAENQVARFESTDAYAGIELKDNGSSTLPPLISALSDDILFYGGHGSSRPLIMTIDGSTSRVGIGTTSPDNLLQLEFADGSNTTAGNIADESVTGLVLTNTTDSDGNGTMIKMESNNGSNATAIAHIQDDATSSHMAFYTELSGTFSEKMRIQHDGNVQIPDNAKFRVGTGQDCSYYHTGTDSYLQNGTGHLYLHNNASSKFIHILQEGASGGITLSTNNTEKMRIDSNGNVGIGTTDFTDMGSSSYKGLKVGGATLQDSGGGNGSATFLTNNSYVGGSNNLYLDGGGASSAILMTGGDIDFLTFHGSGGSADAQWSYSSRMKIAENGRVGINETSPNAKLHIEEDSSGQEAFYINHGSSGNQTMILFKTSDTTRGSIQSDNSPSQTAYNTSSDERLKENIVEVDDALSIVNKIPVKQFNFIEDENNTPVIGYIGQELIKEYPQAVSVVKTSEYDNHHMVDQSKMVAVLMKAVQELSSKVETLKLELKTELQDTKDYVDHKQDYNSMAGRINSCEARIGHLEKK